MKKQYLNDGNELMSIKFVRVVGVPIMNSQIASRYLRHGNLIFSATEMLVHNDEYDRQNV